MQALLNKYTNLDKAIEITGFYRRSNSRLAQRKQREANLYSTKGNQSNNNENKENHFTLVVYVVLIESYHPTALLVEKLL